MKINRVILDPGHGGMAFGRYMTAGKRSPEIGHGVGIYEGVFNRNVCKLLERWFFAAHIDVVTTVPGPIQVSLNDRLKFINTLCKGRDDTIVLSIHANAMDGGWGGANGWRIFRPKPLFLRKKSGWADEERILAWSIFGEMDKLEQVGRRLGGMGTAGFKIIRKSKCPALLVECAFMTHKGDAAWMSTLNGEWKTANAIFLGVIAARKNDE